MLRTARLSAALQRGYWSTFALLFVVNTLVLGMSGALAGLSLDAITTGAREVVVINVLAMTLLIWPILSLTVRGLAARRSWCLGLAGVHALGMFALMEIYFGKPLGLASASPAANVLPTLLFIGLTSWVVAEWRALRQTQGRSTG
ncbi:MAG: hypothetical protein AAFQ42_05875 [Pseudomonadota bacterium]